MQPERYQGCIISPGRARGALEPMPVAMAMRWLNDAANGSVAFQRYVEAGNPRLPGKGVRNETFGAVEAALFRSKGRATSVIQNVSDEARVWRIKPDLKLGAPSLVERLELPDLTDSTPCAARLEAVSVSPTLAVRIPPYSLTRLIWNSRQATRGQHSAQRRQEVDAPLPTLLQEGGVRYAGLVCLFRRRPPRRRSPGSWMCRRPTWLKVDCCVIVSRVASDVFDRVKHVCPNDRLAARSLRAG